MIDYNFRNSTRTNTMQLW